MLRRSFSTCRLAIFLFLTFVANESHSKSRYAEGLVELNCRTHQICNSASSCAVKKSQIKFFAAFTEKSGLTVFFGSRNAKMFSPAEIDPRLNNLLAKLHDLSSSYGLGVDNDTNRYLIYSLWGEDDDVFQSKDLKLLRNVAYVEMSCNGEIPW